MKLPAELRVRSKSNWESTVPAMPWGGVTVDDYILAMMAEGDGIRAARYRQEAEKFRRMAQTESDDDFRNRLVELARQYDDMANGLLPAGARPAP